MTSFFDNRRLALLYAKATYQQVPKPIIAAARHHLKVGGRVLELGMGAGGAFSALSEWFDMTGSEHSGVLREVCQKRFPDKDILSLDAATIMTDRRFDAVFSNKVFQHLDDVQVQQSLGRQARILNAGGVALHTFWHGAGEKPLLGGTCHYRPLPQIQEWLHSDFEILSSDTYGDEDAGDSFWIAAQKK